MTSSKSHSSLRMRRNLRRMAELGISVEFHLLDGQGKSLEVGPSKVQEYREEENVVMVASPTQNGKSLMISAGEMVRLVFEFDDVYYQFETVVLERLIENIGGCSIPVLKLQTPAKLNSASKRQSYRVEPLRESKPVVHWRPLLEDRKRQNDVSWIEAVLQDISSRSVGLLISNEVAEKLRQNVRVELSILPRNLTKPILVDCFIQRIDEKIEGKELRPIGLEFELVRYDPEATHPRIASFVAECERENAANLSGVRMGRVISDMQKVQELLKGSYHSRISAFR